MDETIEFWFIDQFEVLKEKSLSHRISSIPKRREKLLKLEKWILTNRSIIQDAIYKDLQKPPQEVAITEIYVVLAEIRLARKNLKSWAAKRYVSTSLPFLGTSTYVYHEPKGACLIISPWNYPFQLAIAPLVSAISAGNTVMIKPSEHTNHTASLIKRLCDEVFESDEVKVVQGGVEVSTELLKLPFDHIFFTGSPEVGKIVMATAAKNLTSVTLELGGKSPTIIDATADIKDAAAKIAWGKWQNAGQVCIAPDYLFVHEDTRDSLVKELAVWADKLYGEKANYGGIVNKRHYERMHELMANAIENGASIEFGGQSDSENLLFSPTLISSVGDEARIVNEEIFGPILTISTFKELSEVISYINGKPKPLALYLFSKSKKNIELIQKYTSSGMMAINETVLQFANPHLPIGGVNNSGIGKSHGHAGFMAFTNEKAVLKQRRGITVVKMIYPPYSRLKNFLIDLLIRYF